MIQMEKEKKENNQKGKFTEELIDFYKLFISGTSNAIKKLASIQKKHKKEYELLKEMQKDPKLILELSKELDKETKGILFEMLMKSSLLANRSVQLFELTTKEQEDLAEDLNTFAKDMERNLKYLKNKRD